MFKTRLLSGIMLMIIALTTVIAGGQVLFTVPFALSLIAQLMGEEKAQEVAESIVYRG